MAQRIQTIDVVRGVAVMGILLMNIVSFAMPERASLSPRAWLPESFGNTVIWAATFILIDNKFRGLFSLLFGASMLLMLRSAEARGTDAVARHMRRMLWLLVFGLAHLILIWDGDILALYAIIGCCAVAFRALPPWRKIALALLCFISHFAIWGVVLSDTIQLDSAAQRADASRELIAIAQQNRMDWGDTGSPDAVTQIATHQAGYTAIVQSRLHDDADMPIRLTLLFGLETLGLMLLGMAMLETGLLAGRWPQARTFRLMLAGYALSLPGMLLLTAWCAGRGWSPVATSLASLLWSVPFREIMTVAHAALFVWLAVHFANAPLTQRLAAVGQMALSNYLGTSLVMTFVFYGYGLGLYGQVSRAQAYLICLPAFALMLIWSPVWLQSHRQGPLEWVWRMLTDWRIVPLRRAQEPA